MRNWRWFIAGALAALNGLLMGMKVEPPPVRTAAELDDRVRER